MQLYADAAFCSVGRRLVSRQIDVLGQRTPPPSHPSLPLHTDRGRLVSRQIDVLGQRTSKVFEVAEYVLPRFEVTVDLPPYATFDDPTVTATVHAK